MRWTAAGMREAERQFRRIIGYRDLAKLALAIERDLAHTTPVASPTEEAGAAQRRAPVVALARDTGEEVIGWSEKRFGEPQPRWSWVAMRSSLLP